MFEVLIYLLGLAQGVSLAYMWFAPDTNFKRGFMDGISLKFIWGRFVK